MPNDPITPETREADAQWCELHGKVDGWDDAYPLIAQRLNRLAALSRGVVDLESIVARAAKPKLGTASEVGFECATICDDLVSWHRKLVGGGA